MLDINFIRDNIDRVRYAIVAKKKSLDLDNLLFVDDKRKKLQQQLDQMKFDQKKAGENRDIELAKSLKDQIASLSKDYEDIMVEFDALMLQVPNLIHDSVPE